MSELHGAYRRCGAGGQYRDRQQCPADPEAAMPLHPMGGNQSRLCDEQHHPRGHQKPVHVQQLWQWLRSEEGSKIVRAGEAPEHQCGDGKPCDGMVSLFEAW